ITNSEVSRECGAESCVDSTITDYMYYEKVLQAKEITHFLNITGLFGIYHDLHLKLELPVVLQRTNKLSVHEDIDEATAKELLKDPDGNPMFNIPFTSADRSGIDYFVTGLEWGIMNQSRNESHPDWNIYIEGLWGVGAIMKPAGSTDIDGDLGYGDPGISRGNLSLRGGTRMSKRFKYINPYFGFEFLFEFPQREAPYPYNNATVYDGQVNVMPPMRGYIHFGMEVIPWEKPARQQKLFFDLMFIGGYVSEGRDFSVLSDALGTSNNPYLNYYKGSPDWWENKVGTEHFIDTWNQNYGPGDQLCWNDVTGYYEECGRGGEEYDWYGKEHWTGLTDQENYGTFGGRFTIGFITSKWFKIMAGVQVRYNQPHFITFADQCNSGSYEEYADGSSNCVIGGHSSGVSSYNPDYRAILDEMGNRFKISSTIMVNVFVNAVAMF
ncbi:MAG: hypothetical protein ABIJ56_23825, partial [Pseudomonadota bacterium]